MPIQSIPFGPPAVLTQNTVFALPAAKATIFTADTTPALEISNTSDFAAKSTVTLTAGSAIVGGGFIRSTGASPITIVLKRD